MNRTRFRFYCFVMLAGLLLAGTGAAYAADDGGATYGVVQLRSPGGKVRSGGEPFTLTMDEDVLVDVKEPCQWLSDVLIQRANAGQVISNPFKTDPKLTAVERYKAEYACEKLVEDRLKNSYPMVDGRGFADLHPDQDIYWWQEWNGDGTDFVPYCMLRFHPKMTDENKAKWLEQQPGNDGALPHRIQPALICLTKGTKNLQI